MPAARVVHFPCALYSVVPRPISEVFGLGAILRVRMHTKLENGVLQATKKVELKEYKTLYWSAVITFHTHLTHYTR